MQTRTLPEAMDLAAPDGSEIRLLVATARTSTVHCRLPPGGVSLAVTHRTVEEVWYVLAGTGTLWRRLGEDEGTAEETRLAPGVSADIPLGAHFQFRNDGDGPLDILIATTPPWPGADEAVRVAPHWPTAT